MEENNESTRDGSLPPDIIESTLPFLSEEDIKNLSQTNKYYNKLLNLNESTMLWHDKFHKNYSILSTAEEPFRSHENSNYMTCQERILRNNFPILDWSQLYELREQHTQLYTWGCLKHARLGYTAISNDQLDDNVMNGTGSRFKFGVNTPIRVPWFPSDSTDVNDDDKSIVQISGGGFSFQILTKSGKLFSTGATFSGGHNGPGPQNGDVDFNPFRDAIRNLEQSYPRILVGHSTIAPHGSISHHGPTPVLSNNINNNDNSSNIITSMPHRNIYREIEILQEESNEQIGNNSHITRMFTRNSFPIYRGNGNNFQMDYNRFGKLKFIAISSGRSHFIALNDQNEIYSWDNNESNHGIKINFNELNLDLKIHPILKIATGWDFSCIYVYEIGLIIWKERDALKKGDLSANAHYHIIPNTNYLSGEHKLIDFTCVQDNIVYYIDMQGEILWKYEKGKNIGFRLPIKGKLSKIISCLTTLVIFTEFDCYSMKLENGNLDINSLIKLDIDQFDDKIISICSGDYHTLALTEKGNIYSWGIESQFCGCLGLGKPEVIVNELHIGEWGGPRNVNVLKPTKIPINENQICIGLTAGGWQSAALIVNTETVKE